MATTATTWPTLAWDDVQADLDAILATKTTTAQDAPLAADVEDVNADSCDDEQAKIRALATEIFLVHASLTTARERMRCNASLVRVIQTYLMAAKMDPADAGTKAVALQWLASNAPDWAIPTSHLDESALLDCIRDDILHASTKDDFLKHFESATHEAISFPAPAPATPSPPPSSLLGPIPEVTAIEAYQDAKDIQRDQIQVNGIVYPGIVGYDSLVAALTTVIANVHSVFRDEDDKRPQYEAMAKRVLHTINRTESGGSSYEVLSQLMPPIALLRPNSKDANALVLNIDVGPYEASAHVWCLGLRVRLTTSTAYVICDADDPTDEWCAIDVVYCNRLAFAFGDSPYTSTSMGARVDRARISFAVIS
ncbi:hypothetical protein SDRG_12737 [Saprolegnia diclina VS20]|uniref:Uncharacterized protein n=1 Tax=Saprolegnia diclina (strain VS20) TaxID=1156394 RepID=T0PVI2_SAPDV|nr:hypothetical protein SDRG_12737 [Saprolegnia diclina VS20]EQC29489.1 hypothetical protein SDRG_12737 [Saprolegnia diclina VS20]|eukprot:XP_008617041.1 hypothetical protein SDRG_12737 [Saprolegnia diclina VS20]